MNKMLRVLNLEDNPDDSWLLRRHLRTAGYDCTLHRVQTQEDFARALDEGGCDIVLADYFLPGFTASEAVRILRAKKLDVPFIVISGAVGEEAAVEVMREGAADYVMKDHLTRLVPVIERELAEARKRAQQRQTEEALRRSEKIAAAGRLAAAIAHEINNPLEALTNLLYIAREQPELAPPTRELLATADHELQRVCHIARQTLAFYRESNRPSHFDLAEMARGLIHLYDYKLQQRGVRVIADCETPCIVQAVLGEIRQVFSNLLANAIDASSSGCLIRIRIRNRRDWSRQIAGTRIVIADQGCGISQENLFRIFEAFFTTKQDGTGTGLGLWVTRNILNKHEASIRLRSTVGPRRSGTVVSVFLPAKAAASLEPPKQVHAAA